LLTQLSIENLRNISAASVDLRPGISAFVGPNGAGKTTVLDAVHVLGTGKPFTSHHSSKVIQGKSPYFQVVGHFRHGGSESVVGVKRLREGGGEVRLAGKSVKTLSTLVHELPLILINANTLDVLREGPEARRKLVDQLVFHVEHSFVGVWQRYYQVLKQRNALLRKGAVDDDAAWVAELAVLGEQFYHSRVRATDLLTAQLLSVLEEMKVDFPSLRLALRSGWKDGVSIAVALELNRSSDMDRGYTQVGPHRGDLTCFVAGGLANDVLSRGQMKVLMSAIRIAQGRVLKETTRRAPIYLLDDVGAELDAANAQAIFSVLAAEKSQVLATMVALTDTAQGLKRYVNDVFHVEQGVLTSANKMA
jgi:DNA replication and repair protein RecF